MTLSQAFTDGWYEGAVQIAAVREYEATRHIVPAWRACSTIREAETRHPDWTPAEIEVHLNGVQDGLKGDRFRLDGLNARSEG